MTTTLAPPDAVPPTSSKPTAAGPGASGAATGNPRPPAPEVTAVLAVRAPASSGTTAAASAGSSAGPDGRANGGSSAPSTPSTGMPETATAPAIPPDLHLSECLDALAEQTRPPERLVVVDLSGGDPAVAAVLRDHEGIRRAVDDLVVVTAGPQDVVRADEVGVPWARVVRLATGGSTPQEGSGPPAAGEPNRTDGGIGGGSGDDAHGARAASAGRWLWLLHDDTAPQPTALARLVDGVRRSRTVGIAGPKIVEWAQPRRLVELGLLVTRAGGRVDTPSLGEADQGQYDGRSDVIAVGGTGMLVSHAVLDEIGGFEPAFGPDGADLDLGWRAQLAGHRVVVVPQSVVRDAAPRARRVHLHREGSTARMAGDTAGSRLAALRARRRAGRRVALTRCSLLAAPFLALWIVLDSLASALFLLLLKRPQHAWVEVGDIGALFHPASSIAARWRFRGHRQVRRRHLASLFVSPGTAAAGTWDRVQDALTPDRSALPTGKGGAVLAEPGPVAEEAESLTALPASLPQRIVTNPGFLAVLVCAVLSGLLFRSALGQGVLDAQGPGLAGGELNAVTTDAAGLWHLFRDSWHGAGFGNSLDVSPFVGVLAGYAWLVELLPYVGGGRSPASVAIAWLMLAAMPLSAASAYLAGRVATRARWGRGLVALAWGGSAGIVAAVTEGRLSMVVAHIVLPLAVAGFCAALKPGGTWTATFAAALATGVVGAFAPVLLVVSMVVALVVVIGGPGLGRRLRALVLAVVPIALLGPWVLRFLADPWLLLTGPGLIDVTTDPGGVPPWQVALGLPDGGTPLLAWLFAPVLFLAAVALLRSSGGRGRAAALSVLAAVGVVGLVLALAAPRIGVGPAIDDSGTPALATLWSGVGVDLYVVAVLAVLLAGWHGLGRALGERRLGWRRIVAAVVVAVASGAVLVSGSLLAWQGMGSLTVGGDALPAVAVDQAKGPMAPRLLVISPSPERVDYEVIGAEPGNLMRDVDRPVQSTDPGVGEVVSGLASGALEVTESAGAQLADLGVGFVSLRDADGSSMARTLDAAGGLTRLGSEGDQTLWRVQARPSAAAPDVAVPPSRVRIDSTTGAPIAAVPVDGPHGAVEAQVPVGPAGRTVVFAQPPEWSDYAQVTLDGASLAPVSAEGTPTYRLPTAGGALSADLPPAHPQWFAAQLILLAVVVFMAIPFGTRRSRRIT